MARTRITAWLAVLAALASAGITGCSSSEDDTAGPVDLSTVTLKVGDQVKATQSLLDSAGELTGLPYKIEWASFEAGPPLLEAAAAGKIDFGGTGDVPPVFAQAAKAPLKIVGTQARDKSNEFLLVPQASTVTSIADLKGKTIAFTQGSSAHGLVLALLKKAGLSVEDVNVTYLNPPEALSAFAAGKVDAWAVWNPFAAAAIGQAKAKIIADGTGLTTQQNYFLASEKALNDPATRAAIADLLARITRANQWSSSHEDQWVPIFSRLTKLPEPIARASFATASGTLVPTTDAEIAKQQELSDLFTAANVIPSTVTASEFFDTGFNDAVTKAAGR